MQTANEKTVTISTRIKEKNHKRLHNIIEKSSKYLNVGAFVRDAIIEKIEREAQ